MKLKTSIILSAAVIGVSVPAVADSIWDLYVGATIGAGAETIFADNHEETNAAQSFGAMFGVDLPAFRIEAEYNYLSEKRDLHAHVGLLNAYFKMPSTVIKPYLGLGVGLMFAGENENIHVDFDTTAAYQGMLGVTFDPAALPFKFDIEARTIYMPDIYKVEDIEPDVMHYEARIKIRYIF